MDKVDFVIDWVDDSDPDWNAERRKYKTDDGDNRSVRYRDWNLLKYWFRSVEKNASWVNKIYFVTYGHLPNWLDTTNSKIEVIKVDCKIKPNTLHKKAAETLMVID